MHLQGLSWGWNTGALYTDHGQRIGVFEDNAGNCFFSDIDRGIDGVIPKSFYPHLSAKDRIRKAYLENGWEYWAYPSSIEGDVRDSVRAICRQAALEAPSLALPKPADTVPARRFTDARPSSTED